jgi:hypothetical protein
MEELFNLLADFLQIMFENMSNTTFSHFLNYFFMLFLNITILSLISNYPLHQYHFLLDNILDSYDHPRLLEFLNLVHFRHFYFFLCFFSSLSVKFFEDSSLDHPDFRFYHLNSIHIWLLMQLCFLFILILLSNIINFLILAINIRFK